MGRDDAVEIDRSINAHTFAISPHDLREVFLKRPALGT